MKQTEFKNGVYVAECKIPQTNTFSKTIYFVCNENGDEFGQFDNELPALELATKMEKLNIEEQHQFDY